MLKRCDFRARRKEGCESISLMFTGRLFQMSGPQTEKSRRPNWVLVRRTTADLICWPQLTDPSAVNTFSHCIANFVWPIRRWGQYKSSRNKPWAIDWQHDLSPWMTSNCSSSRSSTLHVKYYKNGDRCDVGVNRCRIVTHVLLIGTIIFDLGWP